MTALIPRRAAVAVVTTILSLALLFSFRTTPLDNGLGTDELTGPDGAGLAQAGPDSTGPSGAGAADDSGIGPSPLPGSPGPGDTLMPTPGGSVAPGSNSGPTPTPKATKAPAPTAQPTKKPSPTPTPVPAIRTVTGAAIKTRYGNVQVAIVLNGAKITDVKALQMPDNDPRSADISQMCEPILHDEALAAQSANIATVSGATYTSDGYRKSLQSAIDRS